MVQRDGYSSPSIQFYCHDSLSGDVIVAAKEFYQAVVDSACLKVSRAGGVRMSRTYAMDFECAECERVD